MSKGLRMETDSVKATDSMEIGVTCEDPNVLQLDEHSEAAECI